ncbi:MAG: sulfatase [Planctomycetes bacterium]|nr:sulfatase [Planctomycetota bacterium]
MGPLPRPAPASPTGRLGVGPAWLSRSLVISAATWLLLLGAGLGVCFGLARAAWETADQRYVELGFGRSAYLLFERAVDLGAFQGAMGALWYLIAVLLGSAYAPVRRLYDPRELAEILAARDRLLRLQVAVASTFAAVLLLRAISDPNLGRADALALGGSGLFAVVALEVVARWLRRGGPVAAPQAEARAFAATAAVGLVALLLPRTLRALSEPAVLGARLGGARAWETATGAVLLALGAVLAFVFVERAVRASQRTHAPAGRAALGGPAVRVALFLMVLPAAGPLLVRAASSSLGRPGLHAGAGLNVILIGVDSLRGDAVDLGSPAPGARDRTPNLRKLAERGVHFSRAMSSAPETAAALASILTGRTALEHGACAGGGRLARSQVTLAEVLREAGYRTGAFVTAAEVSGPRGFGQGVDEFSGRFIGGEDEITSHLVTNQALWFVERNSGRPFFLFAQYTDPRPMWRDHAGWNWANDYAGWLRRSMGLAQLTRDRQQVTPEDLRWLRDLYDEEVAFTDGEIGRLVDAVHRAGLADRTLFVIVGGQGTEFLEHGSLGHGHSLFDELLRVPLIVVPPVPVGPGERAQPVETRDVFATVLAWLEVPFEAPTGSRPLLAPPGRPAPPPPPEGRAFSVLAQPGQEGRPPRVEQAALTTSRWKLVHDVSRGRRNFYDLAGDPREADPIPAARREAAEAAEVLGAALDEWLASQEAGREFAPAQQPAKNPH